MIKNELGKICICGHPAEIAAEFEEIARTVREQLCHAFGNQLGMNLFEYCIKNSKMREEERDELAKSEIEHARLHHPEAVKAADIIANAFAERIFGGGQR